MDVQALRRQIEGAVVHRSDRGYDNTRRALCWNTYLSPSVPEAIVQVASDRDVVATVSFARAHGARIAISGGGHGLCAAVPTDATLLLDLSRLDGIAIDAASRRALVGPAVRNRDFAHALGSQSLAFPYGHCSTVALSGYLLSGGFGWNSGEWGPACFSMEAVDVVLANGTLVTATDTRHADVLWAARGSGAGFFGVATRYSLALYPQPASIATSTFVCALDRAPAIAAWLAQRSAGLGRNLEIMLALTGAPPPLAGACAADRGMACILTVTAFSERERDGRSTLSQIEDCPALDGCYAQTLHQPASFATLFDGMDQLFPAQHRYLAHTVGSDREPGALLASLITHVRSAPSQQSLILCPILAPPPADAPAPPPAAFSLTPPTFVMAYAIWPDAAADAANVAWHEDVVATLEPFVACHYIGETDINERPQRTARCFSPANWQRLQDLRRQYDPDGLFRSVAYS